MMAEQSSSSQNTEEHKQIVDTVLTHSAPLWNLPCHRPQCLEAILYLEMASIPYKRKHSRYNINCFVEELELPFLRHGLQTTRSVIDFCEGIGNVEARIVGKNNGLNAHLERSQKADIPGLQSLVRDRLHLVWLHQLYANDSNWNEYSNEMRHYLPMLLRSYLLKKERNSALRILQRHNVLTAKHAKELLVDSLHALYMKMGVNEHDIIEIQENESGSMRYFFGPQPTSLDAVLCGTLTILTQCQLPVKYIADIREDPKIKYLIKYCKRVMEYHHESMMDTLTADNEITPIAVLKEPKKFEENKVEKEMFYSKWVDTEEKKNSALFVAGSLVALVIYCRLFLVK